MNKYPPDVLIEVYKCFGMKEEEEECQEFQNWIQKKHNIENMTFREVYSIANDWLANRQTIMSNRRR